MVIIYSVSQPPPPPFFVLKRLGNFSRNFTRLLYVPLYAGTQIFIQLPATLANLCHIKRDHYDQRSKCPLSAKTHIGWSHLIWHNFVKVAGN